MATTVVFFDPTAADGSKFPSAAVRKELGIVVPANADPNSVSNTMLQDGSVTESKLGDQAVDSPKIATGGVATSNLAAGAVTSDKIANGGVAPVNCGAGVMTIEDTNGNPLGIKGVKISATDYNALTTPDANTMYFVTP